MVSRIRRPRIGITCRALKAESGALGAARADGWWLHATLPERCREIGALPLLIAPPSAALCAREAREWVSLLDALILGGGGDIGTDRDGNPFDAPCFAANGERDAFEYELLNEARRESIPVLGICRGAQLIQLSFGGHLLAPTPDPDGVRLHCEPELYVEHHHALTLAPGGILPGSRSSTFEVNSAHRWRIGELAQGLRVEARCPDDNSIEAFSAQTGGFLLGVLWHPEFEPGSETAFAGSAIFDCLREAIARRELRAPLVD